MPYEAGKPWNYLWMVPQIVEDWVEQNFFQSHDTTRLGIYRFNGKEKDYESGFHYYGARYYWSETLTGWLSVDPMMDKYPSLSPYNYCAWNPVKLVDPDGEEIRTFIIGEDGSATYYTYKITDSGCGFFDKNGTELRNEFTGSLISALTTISEGENGKALVDFFMNDKNNVIISEEKDISASSSASEHLTKGGCAWVSWNSKRNSCKDVENTSYIGLTHDLQHAKNRIQKRPLGERLLIGNYNAPIEDERSAMLMENIVRHEHNLPQRKSYGENIKTYNDIIAPIFDGKLTDEQSRLLDYNDANE